jgi:hypothetical protein
MKVRITMVIDLKKAEHNPRNTDKLYAAAKKIYGEGINGLGWSMENEK